MPDVKLTREEIERLLKLAERATKLPWHWATSNSMRRLSNEQQDGKVAFGQVSRHDGVADIAINERDMEYSEAACNAAPALCRQLLDAMAMLDRVHDYLEDPDSHSFDNFDLAKEVKAALIRAGSEV